MKTFEYLKLKETLDEQITLLVERARENPEDAGMLYELCGHLVECNRILVTRQFSWPLCSDDA